MAPELRLRIYEYLLEDFPPVAFNCWPAGDETWKVALPSSWTRREKRTIIQSMLRTCRVINRESRPVLFGRVKFDFVLPEIGSVEYRYVHTSKPVDLAKDMILVRIWVHGDNNNLTTKRLDELCSLSDLCPRTPDEIDLSVEVESSRLIYELREALKAHYDVRKAEVSSDSMTATTWSKILAAVELQVKNYQRCRDMCSVDLREHCRLKKVGRLSDDINIETAELQWAAIRWKPLSGPCCCKG
jgi:hypothetical protein